MNRTLPPLAALVAVCLFAAGCASDYGNDYRGERRRDYGGRDDRDGGYTLLGRRDVDFRGERDVIEIGKSEGRFKKLRIAVANGSIELFNMRIIFDNGERYSPDVRMRFDEGTASREIDLPGDKRTIRRVEFDYKSTSRREGRAVVSLYGR